MMSLPRKMQSNLEKLQIFYSCNLFIFHEPNTTKLIPKYNAMGVRLTFRLLVLIFCIDIIASQPTSKIDSNKKPEDLYEAGLIIGALKEQLNEVKKYKEVVVLRSKIEYLEDLLLPRGVINPTSRCERWILILRNTNDERIQKIYDQVLSLYGKRDPEKSIRLFASALQKIYADASAKKYGPHNLADHEVFEELRENKNKDIEKLLSVIGVDADDLANVNAIKVLAEKLFSSQNSEDKTSFDSTVKDPVGPLPTCVRIYPDMGPGRNFKKVQRTDVEKSFHLTGERAPGSIDIKEAMIKVDFGDYSTAVRAMNNHNRWLSGIKVKLELF